MSYGSLADRLIGLGKDALPLVRFFESGDLPAAELDAVPAFTDADYADAARLADTCQRLNAPGERNYDPARIVAALKAMAARPELLRSRLAESHKD